MRAGSMPSRGRTACHAVAPRARTQAAAQWVLAPHPARAAVHHSVPLRYHQAACKHRAPCRRPTLGPRPRSRLWMGLGRGSRQATSKPGMTSGEPSSCKLSSCSPCLVRRGSPAPAGHAWAPGSALPAAPPRAPAGNPGEVPPWSRPWRPSLRTCRRQEQRAGAGGQASGHPGGGRERRGQDHHHWQAGTQVQLRRGAGERLGPGGQGRGACCPKPPPF